MNIQQRVEAIILAILSLARSEGRSNILRTVLMKLLYLLDVYVAEANAGRETLTGLEWKFYHYGPYSVMAAEVIDDLAKRGMMWSEETNENERDEIVADIQEMVDACSQNVKIEHAKVRFNDLPAVAKDIRQFKALELSAIELENKWSR